MREERGPPHPTIEHQVCLHVCYLVVSQDVVENQMMANASKFWNLCLTAAIDLTSTASIPKL